MLSHFVHALNQNSVNNLRLDIIWRKAKHIFINMLMQKELLELIQQTTNLLKSDLRTVFPASKEVYTYFTPSKKSIVLEAKKTGAKEATPVQNQSEQTSSPQGPTLRSTLEKIAPHMKLLDIIPNDFQAQKVANAWSKQTEVVIIAGPASNEELLFLKDLARTIQDRLTTVKMISGAKLEKEKSWKSFFEKSTFKMLIIACPAQKYTALMLCYQKEEKRLASIPVVILYPMEVYKQPDQKTALWESLCQIVTPTVSPL